MAIPRAIKLANGLRYTEGDAMKPLERLFLLACLFGGNSLEAQLAFFRKDIPGLGGHPKPAIEGHLKTGQLRTDSGH